MFGYVNIYKDELKVKDYNIYRSYYCGLCKILGKEFSNKSRLSLNYDFTFLALLLSSLNEEKMNVNMENCIIHPLNKRPVLKEDPFLSYSAYMSVIVTYFKLKDDVFDLKSIKNYISLFLFGSHIKKARKKYPYQYEKIKELLDALRKKEKEKCPDIDEVSDLFGKVLEVVFLPDNLKCSDMTKKAILNFSYNLGRFIYIIDALDDIEKDILYNNFNPFIYKYSYQGENAGEFAKKVYEEYDLIVTLTLSDLAKAFELIEFKKNKDIIENIVYLGLRKSKDKVIKGE